MSKFIDRLNRLSRPEPQPIGFRATQIVGARLRVQLAASIAQENAKYMADHVAGADAGIVRITEFSSGAEALRAASRAVTDIPWGGWLAGGTTAVIERITDAGCDFVIFPAATTPLAALQSGEVGKILEIDASLSEGLLRATNDLPVDAVLLGGEQLLASALTWQFLVLVRRLADLLNKPLLVPVPSEITSAELQALWEAGVKGIVALVGLVQPKDRIKELRQTIDRLTFPSPRKGEKPEPRLYRIGQETGREPAEEEEEEEEEEE